jgi:LysM repeat protein
MRKSTLCLALVLIISMTLVPTQLTLAKPADSFSLQSSANDLVAAVNALRFLNGLPAYTNNSILMQVAQDQANFMAATGQVAHRPGLTQRILDAGYPLAGDLSQGGFRAENITGGNKTAAQAVQEWTGDALHLNTMLSPNLSEIGAGVAKVGNTHYLVIDCAQPTTSGQSQAYTPGTGDLVVGTSAPSNFIVPIVASTPDEDGLVYHEVQYGQTLWAIAIEYGVKIDEIRALNNLGPGTDIYPGDKLLVRKDAPPPTATAISAVVTVLTDPILAVTSTSLSTMTPSTTDTAVVSAESQEGHSMVGFVIGIVLATLLFAGMLTWLGSRKT